MQYYNRFLVFITCLVLFTLFYDATNIIVNHNENIENIAINEDTCITFGESSVNVFDGISNRKYDKTLLGDIKFDTNSSVGLLDNDKSYIKAYFTNSNLIIINNSNNSIAVNVYDISSKNIMTIIVQPLCTQSVNFDAYLSGIYIVKADNKSFKICKR